MSRNITLDILLARKEQSRKDKIAIKLFYSNVLNGNIEVQKQSLFKILNKLDGINEEKDITENLRNTCNLILEHVPLFKNKELQTEYDCVEPTDIVVEIFDNNIGEINKLASFILEMYGLTNGESIENIKSDIKN